ncbi:MAG: hypothetical protein WAL78_04390 [Candidatus Acidiferrales bacterium]
MVADGLSDMFCPVCKFEFRRGFTHCNQCDVDLVDALPSEEPVDHAPAASAPQQELDQPALLWRGASGGFYSALTTALDAAHIPYNKEELDARLVFTAQHTDLEVWVPAANLSEAQRVLDAALANPLNADAAASGAVDVENEDDTSAAFPAELRDEDDKGADDIRRENVARELYPDDATAEVWSGKNETLADVLKSCLAEIGISCYVERPESESGPGPSNDQDTFAVRVLPADEVRAKHIVRQVTDAAPPA